MRLRNLALLSIVILVAAACAGVNGNFNRQTTDDSAHAAGAVAVNSGSDETVPYLDVDVEQTGGTPVMGTGVRTTDIQYTFVVKNNGTEPATVNRITIWSAGGSYELETLSRKFNKTIAPGTTERLPFWARAVNMDASMSLESPVTIRAQFELADSTGVKKPTYVRSVGDDLELGLTAGQ